MGQTADEVRRDIERTRYDMERTLDAIGDRVSPGRIVERRTARVRHGLRAAREAVMGSAEAATDKVRTTATGIGQAGAEAGGQAASSAGNVAGGLASAADSVAGGVSAAAGTATEAVHQVPSVARQQTSGNPFAAGLIAFGGGLLLAGLIPSSQREQQAAAPVLEALEPLAEQAKQVGQEAGTELQQQLSSSASQASDALKETASQAVEQVRSEATTAGQQVKDQASTAASELKDQGEAGVENVRQQSSQSSPPPQ